jgi:Cys-tRNA(Pro) deacylase
MASEKLKIYLRESGVDARILTFEKRTMTVEGAEIQLRVGRERIIKSILFTDDNGTPVMGIVTGNKRVSEKLMEVCRVKERAFAHPKAVKSFTGYEVGGLPPVGHQNLVRTFIDPKVMTFDKVYGGGGALNAILEIDPQDIKRLTKAEVLDISK